MANTTRKLWNKEKVIKRNWKKQPLLLDFSCAHVELESKSSFPASAVCYNEINYFMLHCLRATNTVNQFLSVVCNNVTLLCRHQCLLWGESLYSPNSVRLWLSMLAQVHSVTKWILISTNLKQYVRKLTYCTSVSLHAWYCKLVFSFK